MGRSRCFGFAAYFSARAQHVSPSVGPKLKSSDHWKVDQSKTGWELLTCVPVQACLCMINSSSDSHNGKNIEMSRMMTAHQGKQKWWEMKHASPTCQLAVAIITELLLLLLSDHHHLLFAFTITQITPAIFWSSLYTVSLRRGQVTLQVRVVARWARSLPGNRL